MSRTWRLLAPVVLLLLAVVAPLALGRETWFLRDVFHTHLAMRWAVGEALRAGTVSLLDAARAGGQPLLGNPNAAPFYPSGLLSLVGAADPAADPAGRRAFFWAFNAHFWLHWLIAPLAMAWLARVSGLRAAGAALAAGVYATSGYLQSQLAFFNLIPAVALAPALAAAVVAAGQAASPVRRLRLAAAAGGLWALVILGGDPLLSVFTVVIAVSAWALLVPGRGGDAGWWRRARAMGGGSLVLAASAGTLIASPQLVELWRIAPTSFRGARGYSPLTATVASLDPRQVLEWLVPFAFGHPERIGAERFWGHAVYTDWLPYFGTLYPGLLVFVLLAAAGWGRRRAGRWAWAVVLLGVFLALGRFNPLAAPLFTGWGGLLRYPIKAWLLVAVGGSLLAGIGFERLLGRQPAAARRAAAAVILLLALVAGLALWLTLGQPASAATFDRWMVAGGPLAPPTAREVAAATVAAEMARWVRLLAIGSLGLAWCLWLTWAASRFRSSGQGGATARQRRYVGATLAVHAGLQLWLLADARPTDLVLPYTVPSPLLAFVPPDARVVQLAEARSGPTSLARGRYPAEHVRWLERRAFYELYPFAGALYGRRYELNPSPEGLDSLLSRLAAGLFERADARGQLALLRAWGVTHVIADRPPEPALGDAAAVVVRLPSFGQEVVVSMVRAAMPEVALRTVVHRAGDVGAAAERLLAADFAVEREVVVAASATAPAPAGATGDAGTPGVAAAGSVAVLTLAPERLEVITEAAVGAVLVVQRAHQPLWRASVDGVAAPTTVANLYRLAVEVPPGRHRVRLWVDRRPLLVSGGLALLGFLGLLALLVAARRAGRVARLPPADVAAVR